MARRTTTSDVYVATGTFACEIDGEPIMVQKGETRVREGHKLLDRYRDSFEAVDTKVHYDYEQATAAPGEKRGAPPATTPSADASKGGLTTANTPTP